MQYDLNLTQFYSSSYFVFFDIFHFVFLFPLFFSSRYFFMFFSFHFIFLFSLQIIYIPQRAAVKIARNVKKCEICNVFLRFRFCLFHVSFFLSPLHLFYPISSSILPSCFSLLYPYSNFLCFCPILSFSICFRLLRLFFRLFYFLLYPILFSSRKNIFFIFLSILSHSIFFSLSSISISFSSSYHLSLFYFLSTSISFSSLSRHIFLFVPLFSFPILSCFLSIFYFFYCFSYHNVFFPFSSSYILDSSFSIPLYPFFHSTFFFYTKLPLPLHIVVEEDLEREQNCKFITILVPLPK